MTDALLVAKKLALVETSIRELRDLAPPEKIRTDLVTERFAAHTLQMAIQAMIDAGSHVISDERLGEPTTQRDVFELLAAHGWVPDTLLPVLRDAVGFRNLVVHHYDRVLAEPIAEIVAHRLGDLQAFVDAMRARLGAG